NQTAYSLFLFIRDIADGDLVAWIDTQLAEPDDRMDPDRITRMIEALVGPLRQVHGVSDKVVMMTLSSLLLVSSKPLWPDVGASMIAVDTLVHNFLQHRHPAPARRQPSVWCRLLPAKWLCRHHPDGFDQDRCPAVQPNIPASLSAVLIT